jgi:hypothetical protein
MSAFTFRKLRFIKPFRYKTRMTIAKPRMKMIIMIAAIIPLFDEPVSSTDAKVWLSFYY